MLCSLLQEELALFTLGDNFHRIIISCWPVESVPECFPTMECAPQTPLWISWSNCTPSSLEIHFIIMPLAPCLYNTLSIRWCILDLRAMCSIFTLSSNIGWLSRYALIGLIQSIYGCFSAPSMIIRSVSLNVSSNLIEGLVSFSTMTSDRIGALKEAIQARWSASRLSRRGTYRTSKP
jgi:hypothetical protein